MTFQEAPGNKLSIATLFVQSNDLFYAPSGNGIDLYDGSGNQVTGDVTSQVYLWDAGSELNQEPGLGPAQASSQPGADKGMAEEGLVHLVADSYDYPKLSDIIGIAITEI